MTIPDAGFSGSLVQTSNTVTTITSAAYTPTIGNGTVSFTMSTQVGEYSIIGDMVVWSANIVWSSLNNVKSSSTVQVSLPSTVVNIANYSPLVSIMSINGFSFSTYITALGAPSAAFITFQGPASGSTPSIVTVSSLAATGAIQVGGSYRTT